MAKSSTTVGKRAFSGSRGRRNSATENPGGRASRPKGKKLPIKSSGTSTFSPSTGTSGRAIGVSAKQK